MRRVWGGAEEWRVERLISLILALVIKDFMNGIPWLCQMPGCRPLDPLRHLDTTP